MQKLLKNEWNPLFFYGECNEQKKNTLTFLTNQNDLTISNNSQKKAVIRKHPTIF